MPLAVSNGKMPVAAPKAAVKQKRRKGLDLRLCKRFQETGNCTDPHCSLAHGAEDLKQRQMAARSVLLSELKSPQLKFHIGSCDVEDGVCHLATINGAFACMNRGTCVYCDTIGMHLQHDILSAEERKRPQQPSSMLPQRLLQESSLQRPWMQSDSAPTPRPLICMTFLYPPTNSENVPWQSLQLFVTRQRPSPCASRRCSRQLGAKICASAGSS